MSDLSLKTRIEAVGTVANGELRHIVWKRPDGVLEMYKVEAMTLEEIMRLLEKGNIDDGTML